MIKTLAAAALLAAPAAADPFPVSCVDASHSVVVRVEPGAAPRVLRPIALAGHGAVMTPSETAPWGFELASTCPDSRGTGVECLADWARARCDDGARAMGLSLGEPRPGARRALLLHCRQDSAPSIPAVPVAELTCIELRHAAPSF